MNNSPGRMEEDDQSWYGKGQISGWKEVVHRGEVQPARELYRPKAILGLFLAL